MTIWFTSDIHFGHRGIITHCNRPWDTIEAMDAGLIANINARVKPGDSLYIIGDVAIGRPAYAAECVRALNGQKFLIAGNHDSNARRKAVFCDEFVWVKDLYSLKVSDADAPRGRQLIVLCHYALRVWNQSHYGAWHLYGHSHGTLSPHGHSMDVGVDAHSYRPICFDEVKTAMSAKTFVPVDPHEERKV